MAFALVSSLVRASHLVEKRPDINEALQTRFAEASGDAGAAALTHRERQILRLLSDGLSNKEIGRRLKVADGTIKVHLHNIFEKLSGTTGS